ncbi:MAG: MFS transporter, partial [Promethearchaeota archaeon]
MILRFLRRFLGVQELPERAHHLIQKVVLSVIFLDLIWFLSSTFYVLFVIDSVGMEQLGVLLGISFLLQAILDYPSGTIGDWIGQRWILFIAFLVEGFAYVALTIAETFSGLLIVYIFRAIAFSQRSGAIETWLDNNYKIAAVDTDPERETYKLFIGRWATIDVCIEGISSVVGGVIATIYFRKAIFAIQAIGMFILAGLFLFIARDFPEIEKPEKSISNYFRLMNEGLRFVFLNPMMLLFVAGICVHGIMGILWFEMIMFPLYYGYTGSDAGTSILRFVVLIIGIPLTFQASKFASKLSINWLPWMRFIDTTFFFWGIAVLTIWFPIDKNTFTMVAVGLVIVLYTSIWFFYQSGNILQQRLFLDLVPDR